MAAIAFTNRTGNSCAAPSPTMTPRKLVNSSAPAVPKKTARGDLELPLSAIAANWLLSPNSDKNTVIKLKPNKCQSNISILDFGFWIVMGIADFRLQICNLQFAICNQEMISHTSWVAIASILMPAALLRI
jgi:hypothetical protein